MPLYIQTAFEVINYSVLVSSHRRITICCTQVALVAANRSNVHSRDWVNIDVIPLKTFWRTNYQMDLILVKKPAKPEFNNSAGRLLSLLQLMNSKSDHFSTVASFYKGNAKDNNFKARCYIEFMRMVGRAFDQFIVDVETSSKIPDASRDVIKDGIGNLVHIAFPINPNGAPRALQQAEIALLRMAASMLEPEPDLEESDSEAIRDSLEEIRKLLESSDLKKSARIALLELTRLSRNALDQYEIYGARGFKAAFKKMLAELMEVYLDEGPEVTKEGWWKHAVGHATVFDTVAAKLLKYKKLLESAATLFLG